LRRRSLLQSALFSARIEGNTLELNEFAQSPKNSKRRRVREAQNLVSALGWVGEYFLNSPKPITLEILLKLHQMVMKDVSSYQIGRLRHELSGIFNQANYPVYVAPSPELAKKMLNKLLWYANSAKGHPLIRAFLAQYHFEKIHPFFDGNGRVGRLLSSAVLAKNGYHLKGLAVVEKIVDEKRSLYYRTLEEGAQSFTEFMLEALAIEAEKTLEMAIEANEKGPKKEDALLPRRQEILNIIRDHKLVNFDTVRRRFLSISPRTLRNDIKQLTDKGFIIKKGTTRGAYYSPT